MASLVERYDSALIGILQSEGQIGNFLDVVFGFLYRKTDFFLVMKDKKSRMGFPEGVAMKLAAGAFKKYESLAAKNAERRQEEEREEKKRGEAQKKKKEEQEAQKKKKEEEEVQKKKKEEEEAQKKLEAQKAESATPELSKAVPEAMDTTPQAPSAGSEGQAVTPTDKTEAAATEKPTASGEGKQNGDVAKSNDKKKSGDEDDDPVLTAQQKVFQANPESYNGAARENYNWSQSISDVDARIHVPEWVLKAADVRVDVSKKYIKASYKEQDGSFKVVVDEPLTWDIKQEETVWTLMPGEHIHINMEKIQERWWEGLIESEPKISVRKIDPSRPITDLDGEAQAKIEEMVFNEHQKRLGKPQSHEIKVNEMLKNAWDLEGSPFRGQPFDPSKVNIQNQGSFNMGGGPPSAPS